MTQDTSLQSLDLILDDITIEINLSIAAIESYAQKTEDLKPLDESLYHLNRLRNIFILLELQGVQRLLEEVINVLQSLPKRNTANRLRLLEHAATALVQLMRYIEHVKQKNIALPQLLLPVINILRSNTNQSILPESIFFNCNLNKQRPNKIVATTTSSKNAEKSRYYRQMYQIGLIEVLRQTNLKGGLVMMQRALSNLDLNCARPTSPNLWWAAQTMIDGFIDQSLMLTQNRLKLFSRLDRQIRDIENSISHSLKENESEMPLLVREFIYLISISDTNNQRITKICKHFNLAMGEVTDVLLRQEALELHGPSDKDYDSLADAIFEEITSIKKLLHTPHESDDSILALERALKQMISLNNLLKILQVNEQIVQLSVAIDLIEKALAARTPLNKRDSKKLFSIIDAISSALSKKHLITNSGHNTKGRNTLSATKLALCKKLHKDIMQFITIFTQFYSGKKDVLTLKNSNKLLDEIQKGFRLLDASKAENILKDCKAFLLQHLLKNSNKVNEDSMYYFADIIGSLEFYLDTLLYTATPSPRILDFAEDSLAKLNHQIDSNNRT